MRRRRAESVLAVLPAVTLLCYLVLSEPPAVLLLFFSALTVHECGHLAALLLLRTGAPTVSIDRMGLRMTPARPLLPHEELVTVLAGPLVNLAVALTVLRTAEGAFFFLLAAVHLLFGVGNLLPLGGSDGERLLGLLLARMLPSRAERVLALLTRAVAALFFFTLLFLYYLTGNGLAGVVFALFFLFEPQKVPQISYATVA